jgi:hypothetical protein
MTLFPLYSDEEWADLDGQEQMECCCVYSPESTQERAAEVKLLLEAAAH